MSIDADRNIVYIICIIAALVFGVVLYSDYKEQSKCDKEIMAQLCNTYDYEKRYQEDDGNYRYRTVYGGRYKFTALGETYYVNNDSDSSSPNSVSKELKVVYYSDDPSIHRVYTSPILYVIIGGVLCIVFIYGACGIVFRW